MKKSELKKIIQEEYKKVLKEAVYNVSKDSKINKLFNEIIEQFSNNWTRDYFTIDIIKEEIQLMIETLHNLLGEM